MDTTLLDLYIRYNNNQNEYEKKFRKEFKDLEKEIENWVLDLPFKDLIEIYIKYSTFRYLHISNHETLINFIYQTILSKLETLDIFTILNTTIILENNIYRINKRVNENKNIVQARTLNLDSDFFLDYNAKNTNKTKDEYKLYYQDELQNCVSFLEIFKNSLKYSIILNEELKFYLEQKITELSSEEREKFKLYLNQNILDNIELSMFNDDYLNSNDNKIEIYKYYRDFITNLKIKK